LSIPRAPLPAALVICLFSARPEWMDAATSQLTTRFGPTLEASPPLPFTETAYYVAEFGTPLTRRILRFARLIPQDTLAQIKLDCIEVEAAQSEAGQRRVNIDPGLLTAERFILATAKNRPHRVPLASGIFADLTLIFERDSLQPLPWTYPSWRSPEIIDLLNRFRAGYIVQLKGEGHLPCAAGEDKTCSGA